MPAPIIIFSMDAVRGRIILNALRFKGLEAVLHNRTIHAEEIIRENAPSVVILDTKEISPNEIDFVRAAYPVLSNSTLILLANPSIVKNLDLWEIKTELCRTDPLDVDLIISKVNALLEQKSESLEAQNYRSQKSEVQKSEVQKDEEPDDDSESLENDLKKFLDLE